LMGSTVRRVRSGIKVKRRRHRSRREAANLRSLHPLIDIDVARFDMLDGRTSRSSGVRGSGEIVEALASWCGCCGARQRQWLENAARASGGMLLRLALRASPRSATI